MADIAQDVVAYLLADTDVSNLVGTRVSTDHLPQGQSMPAIVCRVIDTVPNESLATTPSSFASTRMQVDSYAENRTDANTLSEKVRLRIQNKRGDIGNSRVSAISMASGIAFEIDPVEAGTDQRRFVSSQDYMIHHQTATS